MAISDVTQLFDVYKRAVHDKDVDGLAGLYDDAVVSFDVWGDWSLIGTGAMRAMVEEWFGSLGTERVAVDFEDVAVVPGETVSAASATVRFAAISEQGETLRSMQNRLSWVARKGDSGWTIVHQHFSCPVDPKTMGVIFNKPEG